MTCRRFIVVSAALLTICSTVGCGKKKKAATKVTTSLARVATGGNALLLQSDGGEIAGLLGDSATFSSDVTVKSLKMPIGQVSVGVTAPTTSAMDRQFAVYVCPGSANDDCLVEMTGTALQNLLASAPPTDAVDGTYNSVGVTMCVGNNPVSTIKMKLTAEANIGATHYYTNVASGLSTTGPAEELSIPWEGGCGNAFYLVDQLVIGDGEFHTQPAAGTDNKAPPATPAVKTDSIPLKLYFDLANVAYASGGTTNAGALPPHNGCYGPSAQAPYICLNFPSVAGTVDAATPTVQRYLLTGAGFGPTIFGFYFGSKATPFGAYQRLYMNGTLTGLIPEVLLGPGFRMFTTNADGTVQVNTYNDWLTINSFTLGTHTGSMTLDKAPISSTSTLNGTFPYTATRLN